MVTELQEGSEELVQFWVDELKSTILGRMAELETLKLGHNEHLEWVETHAA